MSVMTSQITSPTIVYSIVHSGSASLAFVRGSHRWPVNSSHRTRKMFPFDDVIMIERKRDAHYNDALMSVMASQITSLTIVYSIVHSGSASLAFVRGSHRWPVNSSHRTRKMFPFDDVIMISNKKGTLMWRRGNVNWLFRYHCCWSACQSSGW